jgi:gamma-glutamyltranspeptidase
VLSNARHEGSFTTWIAGSEILVELEQTTPAGWLEGLQVCGHTVAPQRPYGHGFGHAQVIACRDGYLEGASDPRSLGGAAAGY